MGWEGLPVNLESEGREEAMGPLSLNTEREMGPEESSAESSAGHPAQCWTLTGKNIFLLVARVLKEIGVWGFDFFFLMQSRQRPPT